MEEKVFVIIMSFFIVLLVISMAVCLDIKNNSYKRKYEMLFSEHQKLLNKYTLEKRLNDSNDALIQEYRKSLIAANGEIIILKNKIKGED